MNMPKQFYFAFFALLFFSLLFYSHSYAQKNPKMETFTFKDYPQAWKKVDSLMQKGLPKSALEVVNQIYTKAKTESNSAQQVKAIVHRLIYAQQVEENDVVKNIYDLRLEAENSQYPVKPILHSMLAEVYWQYYEYNRWKFQNRTQVVGFKVEDLETWSMEDISEQTLQQHLLALKDAEKLKTYNVDVYDEILSIGGKLQRNYRPTLYDFIAHRAVDFLMNEESSLTKPAYQFTLNNAEYLKLSDEFVNQTLTTKDTASFKFHALKVLQELTKFHLKDADVSVLVDLELKRLAYIKNNLTVPNKSALYLDVLKKLEQRAAQFPISAEVNYQIALLFVETSNLYKPLQGDEHKFDKKTALDICQQAIKKFPDSQGAYNCKALQTQILAKAIQLHTEETVSANLPAVVSIEYQNLTNLYWRVARLDRNAFEAMMRKRENNYSETREIDYLLKLTAVQQWTTALPIDQDYQQHILEEKIPALPFGEYVILVADNQKFSYSKNAVAWAFSNSTNISYLSRSNPEDGAVDFYMLHRQNGTALSNVRAEIFEQEYNYNQSRYVEKKLGDFQSDKNGYFKVPFQGQGKNLYAKFYHNQDYFNTLPMQSYYGNIYQYKVESEERITNKCFLYADRGIYRPGQTIFFKGIALSTNGKQNDLKTNLDVTVYLYDVNSQKVKELQLKTNEYGTFSGNFVLPNTGLNGQMRLEVFASENIQTISHTVAQGETLYQIARKYNLKVEELQRLNNMKDDKINVGQNLKISNANIPNQNIVNGNYTYALGNLYFQVEDYKRPKFEVTFEPVKGSFRLNEEITAKGNAKAFSGANIDGAEVKYRVVRQARFPYWYYYWRGYYPTSPEMEITNGTAKTDEKGVFEIKFKAIPDPDVSKESSPTFTYTVYADITDINGETRSGETAVSVAYKALEVSVSLKDRLDQNEKTELKINSANLSGEFEPAKGTITIHALKSAPKAYKTRRWEQPDKFVYTEKDWHSWLPNELYQDENNFYKWEKENEVLNVEFDTEKAKTLALDRLKSWKQGKYVLEIKSKDKYGEEVKEVNYFTVYAGNEKRLPLPEITVFSPLKTSAEPNEKVSLLVGSSEKIRALYEIEHQGKIIASEWLNINNEQGILEIPVKEAYRGNFSAHFTFISGNRLYQRNTTFIVPYTNKQLDISFETYRNKLQPGQTEEWRLRIKGKQGDKVAAEMVATLYDASLDAFKANYWNFDIYQSYYASRSWSSPNGFDETSFRIYQRDWNDYYSASYPAYDALNWFGYNAGYYGGMRRAMYMKRDGVEREEMMAESVVMDMAVKSTEAGVPPPPPAEAEIKNEIEVNLDVDIQEEDVPTKNGKGGLEKPKEEDKREDLTGVKARTNFNETAFFFPHLQTDENGDILIKFTVPEALTRWKMLGFAHTKDLKFGLTTNSLVTQKDLMVVPNQPRFFRENDKMAFPSKITNVSDKDLQGSAQLFLIDALTGKAIDKQLDNKNAQQTFEIKAGQSTALNWNISIPAGMQAITYKVVAKAGNFTDGEEMTLPVLTNSMLVTETMPLPIRSNQTKKFELQKLTASNKSTTLRNEKFTLEFTSNPAWYAVQALPYLMEFPYECAEQLFSRFYANSIATHIANSSPKIKSVFESWKNITPDALLSNLDKNQELKSVILEETPWLLNANSEGERKRQIGVLFDLMRMSNELNQALTKLQQKQTSSGAWTWFEGMPEDRYITQHIVTGMGHLDNLKVKTVREDAKTWQMTQKAIAFLDRKMNEDYEELKRLEKQGKIKLADQHIGYFEVQYLYARSYFKDLKIDNRHTEAFNYFKGQAQKYWLQFNRYSQGMIALGLHRFDDKKTPADIIKSLKEKALYSEEMGMYWKDTYGYYWYQAPIETHALMIELFDEVAQDVKSVDELKTWLLKQKQTQDWKTTKATAEACYALLLRGANWLASDSQVEITVGNKKINTSSESNPTQVEAGTGYFKTSWNKDEITADMGKITVSKKDEGVAWGAVYWQYFEQLDKITPAETPLKLKKQLFIEKDSDKGKILTPIDEKSKLKVGDVVKVRIELRVDRTMEYVHMKDMRASGFEPMNVISQYKYQDGLGYYESTRDAATHFFFGYLPKGTFVFEYPLRVTHEGDFSNGITTIQCMYAPEFASHSEGIRVKVEKK